MNDLAGALARAYGPRARVFTTTRETAEDDDAAEAVVRAFVLGERYWVGVTETGLAGHEAALAASGLPVREVTLDERRAALARSTATLGIDLKLAQLMSTTLAVIDQVE